MSIITETSLPNATDLEIGVLGAAMMDRGALITVLDILKPKNLYDSSHRKIMIVMSDLFSRGLPVDLGGVINELQKRKELEQCGGKSGIYDIVSSLISISHYEFHCRIIYQKYLYRELIRISNETILTAISEDGDIFEVIDSTSKAILRLADIEGGSNTEPANRLGKALKQIELARIGGNPIIGIPSGLRDLDKVTGGWQKQDLITLAGRPGSGKSALALSIAKAAAKAKHPVLMFSLEMADTQIGMREISMQTGKKYSKLRKGEVTDTDFGEILIGIQQLEQLPIYVDSHYSLNISRARVKLMKAISEKKVELLIIDYLNHMDSEGKSYNKNSEYSEITKQLKRIAKQFDIPVILLCQLNRQVEATEGKRPLLHHLKDSGGIEENSDMVLLLYRPEYYYKDSAIPCPEPGIIYIDVAKHKQGATGDVKVACDMPTNLIFDFNPILTNFGNTSQTESEAPW